MHEGAQVHGAGACGRHVGQSQGPAVANAIASHIASHAPEALDPSVADDAKLCCNQDTASTVSPGNTVVHWTQRMAPQHVKQWLTLAQQWLQVLWHGLSAVTQCHIKASGAMSVAIPGMGSKEVWVVQLVSKLH